MSIARPRARPSAKERTLAAIFLGLGANGERQVLELSRANRHGLVAGVPVFVADVKGDLAGIAVPGSPTAPSAATGRKSRANPGRTAVTSGLGSIATDLAGPLAGALRQEFDRRADTLIRPGWLMKHVLADTSPRTRILQD